MTHPMHAALVELAEALENELTTEDAEHIAGCLHDNFFDEDSTLARFLTLLMEGGAIGDAIHTLELLDEPEVTD